MEELIPSKLEYMPQTWLVGNVDQPGMLATLPYPYLTRLRLNRRLRGIIDDDYLWRVKTARDFDVKVKSPERSWKQEYLAQGEPLAPQLLDAAKRGNESVVRELLDLGVNPNYQDKDKYTALFWAALGKYPEIVRELLKAGANVNIKNTWGQTALDRVLSTGVSVSPALRRNQMKVIEMLEEARRRIG